jgi:hypothetical protein
VDSCKEGAAEGGVVRVPVGVLERERRGGCCRGRGGGSAGEGGMVKVLEREGL